VDRLQREFGLHAPGEAAAFARYVRAWQLVLAGRILPADLPGDVLLRRGPVQARGTRWAFGELATQVAAQGDATAVLAAATLPGAAVMLPPQASGAAPSPPSVSNPLSPVLGAPDLARHPLVTRFSDCFTLAAAPGAGSGSAEDCSGHSNSSNDEGTHLRSGGRRSLAAPAADPHEAAATLVQAYIVLPYAIVDRAWGAAGAEAGQPGAQPLTTPPGMAPQTHLANGRTNPAWRMASGGFAVQGRVAWVAEPRFVAVVASAPSTPNAASPLPPPLPAGGRGCDAVGVAGRAAPVIAVQVVAAPADSGGGDSGGSGALAGYAVVVSGMLVAVLATLAVRRIRQHQHVRMRVEPAGGGAGVQVRSLGQQRRRIPSLGLPPPVTAGRLQPALAAARGLAKPEVPTKPAQPRSGVPGSGKRGESGTEICYAEEDEAGTAEEADQQALLTAPAEAV